MSKCKVEYSLVFIFIYNVYPFLLITCFGLSVLIVICALFPIVDIDALTVIGGGFFSLICRFQLRVVSSALGCFICNWCSFVYVDIHMYLLCH